MIITRAPLRVSFFGGGTDYPEFYLRHGGAVLATAIDKFSYVTASPFKSELFDFSVRVSYSKAESAKRVEDIEHRVFREALLLCGFERDIELHTVADLPAFTGLGSSSSFTVALLQALHSFRGEYKSPLALAREAIDVERNRVGDHVGCQDQVTAAVGGFNLVEFRKDGEFRVHPVPLTRDRFDEFSRHLLLVYTGITRRASDLAARHLDRLEGNVDGLTAMRRMAERGWDVLTGSGSLAPFGSLLHEAWEAKRALDPAISAPEIDELYRAGREAGAFGGKLLGAGGGGFLAFFAPPETHAGLRRAFAPRPILEFAIAAAGSQVIFASE
jgi:D-glycero-alpha-D-manno-heptose-7-phosphate kinase